MKIPIEKPRPLHGWLLAAAILFGIVLFIYLRLRVYSGFQMSATCGGGGAG